jgi:hypothetical protein
MYSWINWDLQRYDWKVGKWYLWEYNNKEATNLSKKNIWKLSKLQKHNIRKCYKKLSS